jgi:hypothetical protein
MSKEDMQPLDVAGTTTIDGIPVDFRFTTFYDVNNDESRSKAIRIASKLADLMKEVQA